MDLTKNIQRSIKFLKKFSKKNKFSEKQNKNFIHVFLLYGQLKYNINLGLNVNDKNNKNNKNIKLYN